jgi:hypothetical protein
LDRPTDARETREVNVPPPRIIPTAPLPPIKHFDPPPAAQLVPPPDDPHADYSEEETAFDTRLPLEQLASLAKEPAPKSPPPPAAGYAQFQWTNEVPWKLWLAFVAVGFTAIVTGFVLGRWDFSIQANKSAQAESDEEPAAENNAARADDVYTHLGTLAAEGTIEFGEGEGLRIQPDAGAWVYAFPLENETGTMLKAEWFESDNPSRVTALQILGGNAVQADASGQFQLDLLRKGKYLLLVSSAHKSRSTAEANAKSPPEVLKKYFEDPEVLMGQWEFHSQEIDYQGEPTTLEVDFL